MSANKDDVLRQFCDVTGAEETRSRFFLESSNWQLEVALSSFYEHGGNTEEVPSNNPAPAISFPTLSDSDMESPPATPARPKKDKKKSSSSKFATLQSLQQDTSSDEDEASKCGWNTRTTAIVQEFFCSPPTCSKKLSKTHPSSESSHNNLSVQQLKQEIDRLMTENCELRKEIARLKAIENNLNDTGQAFYAGGSERSGQQILGPGKNRKDIVTEMFKSVRERGAVVFEDEPSTASRGRGGGVFGGVGYRLGQTSDDHEQITPSNAQTQDQARSVRLRLYREGFTVDSGPLRQYNDPENAEFLASIRRGEIPPELSHGGGEVRVSLEDRRHEECPKQMMKSQAFSGKGHLLGSPTPATVGATVPVAADVADREANRNAAQTAVQLDEGQPITTIQFRLADGSRITGRFNHSHTVADLQQYVSRAEPAYQLQNFALLTTFPSSELADPSVTLAQANLLNSTLLQRLK